MCEKVEERREIHLDLERFTTSIRPMSRTAKAFFLGTVIFSGASIWGVHMIQVREREVSCLSLSLRSLSLSSHTQLALLFSTRQCSLEYFETMHDWQRRDYRKNENSNSKIKRRNEPTWNRSNKSVIQESNHQEYHMGKYQRVAKGWISGARLVTSHEKMDRNGCVHFGSIVHRCCTFVSFALSCLEYPDSRKSANFACTDPVVALLPRSQHLQNPLSFPELQLSHSLSTDSATLSGPYNVEQSFAF